MDRIVNIIIWAVIVIVILGILLSNICIVPQGSAWVIETLGKYAGTWGAGLHLKAPFVSRIVRKISLKEQVADFEPQSVITKDNVTMTVDSVVFFQVVDPKALTYGVERPIAAIENLSSTTLRNIIGTMTLDETLTARDQINSQTIKVLDEAANRWGVDITRVEVQNITPPRTIQEAMEKQMKAEREKREAILKAEGEKQSAITRAEGEKESAILRAEAVKEQRIREAEGEAKAVERMAQAKAEAIRLVNSAQPSSQYLSLRSLEAAEKMADGNATKIIVPSDLQNLAATVAAVTETIKK
ncbi:MAG: SPFH/Band 7/PHB domain protein [Erysipelotrichaceae bacterium]|nr:SPFH/Band 7/PHB domain protein [Erysipelotrichaceae bacterium]MBO4537541.1 SPFH/Band 7/PHB domain protein [Erysipelotrichaceae bacterium]MBR5048665.1 SPFH/Band 7/PHB domain protein [Erysipelotrichaceae bacterium]